MGNISEAQVQQYNANFLITAQQIKSRLEQAVRVEDGIVGASKSVERMGASSAIKRTTRHGDTPIVDTDYSKRWVDLADYEWADLVDDQDKIRMIAEPTNPLLIVGAAALNRAKDDVIIAALAGSSRTLTGGSVALPSGQKVAVGSPATGLTIPKLLAARKILLGGEAYNEENSEDSLHIACTVDQLNDLLGTTQVTSSDYNSVKALVHGDIDTFLGFKFHRTQRLVKVSTTRFIYAWVKSGMVLGIGKDIKSRVSERADKSYAVQVYACMSLGAARTEEEKVVEIACNEA